MIEASYAPNKTNTASISGAFQYDTGQRLRLRGLPTPFELAEKDDFVSGDVVTVQVQFAYEGDSQTESRLAGYDEDEDAWLVAVPDVYLQRSYPVGFFVYVGYGADGEGARSKTMYTGTFKPTGRPAPGDQVTPDQINAWDALVAEVNLAISATNTATSNANAAAAVANKWGNVTTSVETLPEGSAATFEVTETGTGKNMKVGVPRGATGAQGPQGPQGIQGPMGPTGPAGVTFSLSGTTLTITTV